MTLGMKDTVINIEVDFRQLHTIIHPGRSHFIETDFQRHITKGFKDVQSCKSFYFYMFSCIRANYCL